MNQIKIPQRHPHQSLTRRHKRLMNYLVLGTIVFTVTLLWPSKPIDRLAVSFSSHQSYMNDVDRAAHTVPRQSYDWRHAPFVNQIQSYLPLPSGTPHDFPAVQCERFSETKKQKQMREKRRVAVRTEFQRVWNSYRSFAWAADELKPITGTSQKSFGGWGATLVDSLDTLWIMGLKEEFHEAVEAAAAIDFGKTDLSTISVFETTIRYLGGFLSAYDLSQVPVLLEKAVQVGEMLYRAFDTENHTPVGYFSIEGAKSPSKKFHAEHNLCFACLGSLVMEFTRLAQITSQSKYYDAVARITILLDRTQNLTRLPGLWPTMVNPATEDFTQSNLFSIGALADSAYEYFPKMHALLGGLDPVYEKLYRDSAVMIDKHLLFRPMLPEPEKGEDLLFCGDARRVSEDEIILEASMQHLTCFIGGMFGLAGRLFDEQHHVDLGAKLTKGCIFAYESMPTGIMPEIFALLPCNSRTVCPWNATLWEDSVQDYHRTKNSGKGTQDILEDSWIPKGFTRLSDTRYLLRPEAIESVFIMYRITGDQQYLDQAWTMFTSIIAATGTPLANGQLTDVTFSPSSSFHGHQRPLSDNDEKRTREHNIEDRMESFWTAETLKYFYLIFSPPDMISLDDWVFNTEAHPFKRPKRL